MKHILDEFVRIYRERRSKIVPSGYYYYEDLDRSILDYEKSFGIESLQLETDPRLEFSYRKEAFLRSVKNFLLSLDDYRDINSYKYNLNLDQLTKYITSFKNLFGEYINLSFSPYFKEEMSSEDIKIIERFREVMEELYLNLEFFIKEAQSNNKN